MYPILLDQLAREHRDDLLRDADRDRLVLAATPRPVREHQTRHRLGLLLVAAGTRLLCPPHQTC